MGAIDSLARTSAEVATVAPLDGGDVPAVGGNAAIGKLRYFSETAEVLGSCNHLPKHIKTPGDAVAIMMAGDELGLPPMKAIRGLILVEGKVELSADVMLALVKQHGYKVRWPETTEKVATLVLIDPRDPDYHHEQTFTMEDAARAGLATKQNWRKYPQAMLRARVISASVRAFCPEVLAGAYHDGEISGRDETPMSIRDDVETQAAVNLAHAKLSQASASGDEERIESAREQYEDAKREREEVRVAASQDEEQIAERDLVDGWEAILKSSVLSEEDLRDWCVEEGGRYEVLVFHKERARVAIKNCTMAINAVEERKRGKDWITLSQVAEWLKAAPAVDDDDEEAETDVEFR